MRNVFSNAIRCSSALAATLTVACSGGSPEVNAAGDPGAEETGSPDAATEPADTGPPAVRRIGRFEQEGGTFTAEWSASAMQARFEGTEVSALLAGSGAHFATVVDGTVGPVIVTSGDASYPVAQGLSAGVHDVLIFRRDEAFDEPTSFVGFDLGGGTLLPPAATPARRIEMIGDSITAGYGDECSNAGQSFSAATENEYIAYGALAARAVGADVHVVAESARGMYRNLDGTTTETMPVLWERTIRTDPTSTWNPTDWIPDAVVINLGTNDYGAPGPDPSASFTDAYVAFVTKLRGVYPRAYIFCAVGPMLGGTHLAEATAAIESVISTRRAAGDARLATVTFPTQDCGADGSGCGCDYHPSAATHRAMAGVLVGAMKAELGW